MADFLYLLFMTLLVIVVLALAIVAVQVASVLIAVVCYNVERLLVRLRNIWRAGDPDVQDLIADIRRRGETRRNFKVGVER